MKKIFFTAVLTFSSIAMAQGHAHHGGYWARGSGGAWNWMIPTIIGGAIVYEVARQQPVYIQQQPLIIQQQPIISQPQPQNCSPWTETQNPDGTVTRTRTCSQ